MLTPVPTKKDYTKARCEMVLELVTNSFITSGIYVLYCVPKQPPNEIKHCILFTDMC